MWFPFPNFSSTPMNFSYQTSNEWKSRKAFKLDQKLFTEKRKKVQEKRIKRKVNKILSNSRNIWSERKTSKMSQISDLVWQIKNVEKNNRKSISKVKILWNLKKKSWTFLNFSSVSSAKNIRWLSSRSNSIHFDLKSRRDSGKEQTQSESSFDISGRKRKD